MQYRHGDLLIEQMDQIVGEIPAEAKPRIDGVLAYGTATGHSHRLVGGQVLEAEGTVYLQITESGAKVVHEEHHPIDLPVGNYIVVRQRQFNPYDRVTTEVQD